MESVSKRRCRHCHHHCESEQEHGDAFLHRRHLDDTLITASPALLKTSVIMLLQENVFTPAEFMEELSDSYGLSINATEVERLLDLPAGTLAAHKIIKLPNLQLKRNAT